MNLLHHVQQITYTVKTFHRNVSTTVALTFIIMATISMPLNLFKANKVLAQTSQQLQKNLIAQNPTEAALVISERGRTRALVDLLAKRLSTKDDLSIPLSIDKIKQVAKQQNVTLVEYSIITDELNVEGKQEAKESELYIWVIKPTGEITFRNVDLKPLWQKEKTSLTDLIYQSRQSIGANSPKFSKDLKNLSPNLSPARREALNSPPSLVGKGVGGLGFSNNVGGIKGMIKVEPTSKPTSKEKTSLTDLIYQSRQSIGANSPKFSKDLKNLSPNLSPARREALNSPPSLVGKGVGGLGFSNNVGGIKGMIKVEPTSKPTSTENLKKLHQLLIQPIADLLPTQPDDKIIFIPQSSLFLVPFAALPDANGKYLIEKHTISTAPSIQVLDLLYQRQQQILVETRPVASLQNLIVGNPTMPSVSPKPGEKPQQLNQLPGAEEEANKIARLFNTQALTGNVATETTVKQRMSQARIIHFATQANFGFEGMSIPGELAFAPSSQDDGWLKSEEVMNLNLNAELVVLSANDTALGRITGDGVIGLSRSFFAAGVPSAVGSLWSPSDEKIVLLMTTFYDNLSKNPDKAYALRQAMLTTMKKYPNPFDWAGFTLIGAL